jgi:DNA ligase D
VPDVAAGMRPAGGGWRRAPGRSRQRREPGLPVAGSWDVRTTGGSSRSTRGTVTGRRYRGAMASPFVEIEVDNRVVKVTNPDRVYFPQSRATKRDLVEYYLAVGPGIVNALFERPTMLHRFPTGLSGEKVHQKRLPSGAPDWIETVRLHFPRWNRTADELCVTELAAVVWAVQMSTVEFHPWNSRREDPEKPDEWRIDLDPGPLSEFSQVQRVAGVVHQILDELGAVGYPKTSGGKGLHVYVRIRPDHGHKEVRRAALAFAREVERRMPDDVTTLWWRKDRDPHHLFVDYNQNARDHTIAAAYSVRGFPDARVSTPVRWDEVDDVDPHDFTIFTVPARFADVGDLHEDIDDHVFDLQPLREWADRDEAAGLTSTTGRGDDEEELEA